MKLAKSVQNETGMTMFGEGTVLTEQFISRLQSMNIPSLYVEGTAAPSRSMEEELLFLDERFKKIGEEPHMAIIKKIMKEHIESLYPEHERPTAS
jgi:hypothetical protein